MLWLLIVRPASILTMTFFFPVQVKSKPSLNAQLSDICIGTSAAPTYLPAHLFETKDPHNKVREFNLIDGGVAANNPVSTLHHFIDNLEAPNVYRYL